MHRTNSRKKAPGTPALAAPLVGAGCVTHSSGTLALNSPRCIRKAKMQGEGDLKANPESGAAGGDTPPLPSPPDKGDNASNCDCHAWDYGIRTGLVQNVVTKVRVPQEAVACTAVNRIRPEAEACGACSIGAALQEPGAVAKERVEKEPQVVSPDPALGPQLLGPVGVEETSCRAPGGVVGGPWLASDWSHVVRLHVDQTRKKQTGTQWDLVCDNAWKVHIAKFSLLVGLIFGYLITGCIADWVGRRPVLLFSVIFILIFGLTVALSVNVTMFSTLRFFEGFCLAGIILTLYAIPPVLRFVPGMERAFKCYLGKEMISWNMEICVAALRNRRTCDYPRPGACIHAVAVTLGSNLRGAGGRGGCKKAAKVVMCGGAVLSDGETSRARLLLSSCSRALQVSAVPGAWDFSEAQPPSQALLQEMQGEGSWGMASMLSLWALQTPCTSASSFGEDSCSPSVSNEQRPRLVLQHIWDTQHPEGVLSPAPGVAPTPPPGPQGLDQVMEPPGPTLGTLHPQTLREDHVVGSCSSCSEAKITRIQLIGSDLVSQWSRLPGTHKEPEAKPRRRKGSAGIELCPPGKRFMITMVASFVAMAGQFLMPGLAALCRDWQVLQALIICPFLLMLLYWSIFPESLRWLMATQQFEASKKLILHFIQKNCISPESDIKGVMPELEKELSRRPKKVCIVKVVGTRNLWKNIVVLCVNSLTGFGIHHCFARSMMGHEVKVPPLENFYADYYTMASITLASCLAMCVVVRFLGRRGGLLLFMILTALASLLQLGLLNLIGKYSQHPDSGMSDSVKDKFSISFSIVGMFASHAVGSLSVFFCVEVTPTVIRCGGLGLVLASAGFGMLTAPIIELHNQKGYFLHHIIFACCTLICIICILLLPESRDQNLPENISNGEHYTRQPLLPHKKGEQPLLLTNAELKDYSGLHDAATASDGLPEGATANGMKSM
ncbi:Solute carrier family 22 member 23 [Heterocephalus glaber]|uniref:Solute carrier family 22 member 23 n=1 Tax=Heterocephalus glaber TaxID=10181 RepID=G5BGL4_HETGA|nr:Solute carrier family 22 member 23 [Heterocephalus glaber]